MTEKAPLRKVLYASYQTESALPGYIRYALEGLCQTGFSVVYLTNERDLDDASHAFLKSHQIELFFTENHGYDFGMWKRYIQYTAKFRRETWERLVLINDSIVYFQNRFVNMFHAAEDSSADVISLTQNDEIAPHLQSFFLFFKKESIGPFCEFLLKEPESNDFYDTVNRFEVGTSVFLRNQGFSLSSLIHTERPVLFSYPELIREKNGFVKRKLLERRWTRPEALHFLRHGAQVPLLLNYAEFIKNHGSPDSDFNLSWLSEPKKNLFQKSWDSFRFACYRLYWKFFKKGKGLR